MKNLKTWIALLLVVVFTMSLAACGTNGTDNKENPSNKSESGDQGVFSSADDAIYGKITEITGNEIKVAIAKKPVENENGKDDLKGDVITPNENDVPMVGGDGIEDPMDNLELTGETKTFIIPAGVKISNMEEEISLSSLKKGDIISVVVDRDNQDTVVSLNKEK